MHIPLKFGDDRFNGSKVTAVNLIPRWRPPPSFGKGSRYTGDVGSFRKGVPDFLIAFHCNFVDILHSFLANRRNAQKISVLSLPLPIRSKFRVIRGDPHRPTLIFLKLDETCFPTSH